MERPGLQTLLLEEIRARNIQVVVVYKVDRLSRSIFDFHKMMREFSKYEYNFVSITQSFDMSNSMGKLTPNMLLSFARFEREVSSERVRDKIAVLASKLYDDKGQNFRFTSSKKQDKEFLYYYNGMGGEHYLPVEQLDRFVLNMLKTADFDDIEPIADMSAITDAQLSTWITKAACQTVGKKHSLTVCLDEKQVKTDLGNGPKMSGHVDSKPLKIERIEDTIYLRDSFMVDNISSVRLRNGSARNILTIRQLNESLVRGLARGWQLKKRMEQGLNIRELEKEMHMTKRTIMRYINLCYLSPRIVADILEYKNPANLTLRELMNLADSQMDFAEQEKVWSQ